jgi:hypothetical protein
MVDYFLCCFLSALIINGYAVQNEPPVEQNTLNLSISTVAEMVKRLEERVTFLEHKLSNCSLHNAEYFVGRNNVDAILDSVTVQKVPVISNHDNQPLEQIHSSGKRMPPFHQYNILRSENVIGHRLCGMKLLSWQTGLVLKLKLFH